MHQFKRSHSFSRKAQRFALRTTGLLVLTAFSCADFTWAATKEECSKTYLIQRGAKKIVAQIKRRELSDNERQSVENSEKSKYSETQQSPHKFTPRGERASRKTNCAGYVMNKLFPRSFKQGNVDPDAFYKFIVVPLGLKIASTENSDIKHEIANVKANDIVVYLRENPPKAHHVALATGPLVADPLLDDGIPILSKDGDERPYQGFLSWIGGGAFGMTTMHARDPLVVAHASSETQGRVEIHRINPEQIDLHAVSPGECDNALAGRWRIAMKIPPQPSGPYARGWVYQGTMNLQQEGSTLSGTIDWDFKTRSIITQGEIEEASQSMWFTTDQGAHWRAKLTPTGELRDGVVHSKGGPTETAGWEATPLPQ